MSSQKNYKIGEMKKNKQHYPNPLVSIWGKPAKPPFQGTKSPLQQILRWFLVVRLYVEQHPALWYLTDASGQIFPKTAMDSVRQTMVICKDVFALATPDKLWQLYRQNGTKISETSFEEVSRRASQDCSHFSVKLHGKWGSIDKNGNLEFPYLGDKPLYEGNLLDGRSTVECFGESFWVNQQWQLGVRHEKR